MVVSAAVADCPHSGCDCQSAGDVEDMDRVVVRADSARTLIPELGLDMQLTGSLTTVQGVLLSVSVHCSRC